MTLTADQVDTYRKQLVSERARILSNIDALSEELGTSMSDETEENGLESHMGDNATMTFLRERDLSLEEHEEALLEQVDAALKRIEDGTYGICPMGDHPIPAERLEALPWAERCIEHENAVNGG